MDSLRNWTETHIQEQVSLKDADKHDALFYECEVTSIAGATLKNCVFTNSKFSASSLSDLAGATVTLDCHTFGSLEMNEKSLDFFLLLLCKTRGNKEKRQKIIDLVIGRERAKELLREMKGEF